MSDSSVISVLHTVPLLAELDDDALDAIADFSFERTFSAGDAILEEGQTGNGMYIVLAGRVEVVKADGTPHALVLATFGPGEPFGEMALLGEWKRTATVRAIEDTRCLGIDRWVFLAYLQRHPALAIRLLQFVTERLVATDARIGVR